MKNARHARVPKKQVKEIIKEEVAIAIQIVLSGDSPFKYSREADRIHRCPECGGKFKKKVWFQLYDSSNCGRNRNGRISRRYHKTHEGRR